MEKKWVSKKATQPTTKPSENSSNFHKSMESGTTSGIPSKTRKLSLEEEIFTNHIAQIAPPAGRTRWVKFEFHYFLLLCLIKEFQHWLILAGIFMISPYISHSLSNL